MKLRQYMRQLVELAETDPDMLDLAVITSSDEGNGYNQVHFSPSLGHFDGQEFDNSKEANKKPNAICLN